MPGHEEEPFFPDEVGLIDDPTTGRQTGTYEIWNMGELDPHEAELMGSVFDTTKRAMESGDAESMKRIRVSAKFSLTGMVDRINAVPEAAQFVTLGRNSIFAVSVTYENPGEIELNNHPEITQKLADLTEHGGYLTLRVHTED